MRNLWKIFNNWSYDYQEEFPDYDWSIFDLMSSSLTMVYNAQNKTLNGLLARWDNKLKKYGGDPSNHNWNKFRPLRLSREEDWSDWLIYLISESKTGNFSKLLLSYEEFSMDDFSEPLISDREVSSEGHRADIVLQWKNLQFSHIEVKIGDEHLGKTYGTATRMRKFYNAQKKNWNDYILLLESQLPDWESLSETKKYYIHSITWDDVALAIRQSLFNSSESVTWKVWAYSFLGAIEQRLLHLSRNFKKSEIANIDKKIFLLKEGLKNEK